MYRGEAKEFGIDGSVWNCDAVGASCWRRAPRVITGCKSGDVGPRAGLCQGESGSGASLGVPARKSDRMLMASREQGDRSEAIVVHATGRPCPPT